MKRFSIRNTALAAVALLASATLGACVDDNDDKGLPSLEVSPSSVLFAADGSAETTSVITVRSNRAWRLEIADADKWVTPSERAGGGNASVELSVPESNTPRTATLRFSLYNSYGNYLTREVTVRQGAAPVEPAGEVSELVSYIRQTWPSMESGSEPLAYGKRIITATILANNASGNNFGKLYVGDNTVSPNSAIILYSTTDYTRENSVNYPVGRRVRLILDDAQYAPYGNLRELKGVVVELTDDPAVDVVVPTLTAAQLNSGTYQGQYVCVTDITPQSIYVGQAWAEASKRVVKFDGAGGAVVQSYMATASDAPDFASLKITSATGALYGTAEQNYNNIQLIPTRPSDVAALAESAPDPVPGPYISQPMFVPSASSTEFRYYPTHSTINGEEATGFKLGTSSLSGVFTSSAVGVEGTRTLSLYAVAWNGKSATLHIRVDGGGMVNGASSVAVEASEGAAGGGNDYTFTDITDRNRYTFTLEGLTAASTVTFSTSADFASVADVDTGRAILLGVQFDE